MTETDREREREGKRVRKTLSRSCTRQRLTHNYMLHIR